VIQEGLTNARKHSPGATVDLTVSVHGSDGVRVEVVSRPACPSGHLAGPGPPIGAGAGLVGLAERLATVGGELEHGLNIDGDFVLRATVPGP
jgi:signal transduction histidine kinase